MVIVPAESISLFDGKTCRICGQWKPLTAYDRVKDAFDGLRSFCKACSSVRSQQYYQANRARIRAHIPSPAGYTPEQAAAVFWSRVDKTDTCWLWTGAMRGKYGVAWYLSHSITSHRLSWILANGPIPDGLFVCHHCDIPACVRPDHLFLGTNSENLQDASRKGRLHGKPPHYYGEQHPGATITEADVHAIHALAATGLRSRAIARRLNISRSVIHAILIGKTWRHVNKE